MFGIALLGAVVSAAFSRAFVSNLVARGFPSGTARAVSAQGGQALASGGLTVRTFLAHAPAGTTGAQAQAVVDAVHRSFVHAMHVGQYLSIGFMLLASVVSVVFVRSHVEQDAGERVAVHAG